MHKNEASIYVSVVLEMLNLIIIVLFPKYAGFYTFRISVFIHLVLC